MLDSDLTRRRLLKLGLIAPPTLSLVAAAGGLLGEEEVLAATPTCDDGDEPETESQTEGPYFTPGSPRRRTLVTAGMRGTRLTLTGRVLTTGCRPVKRALIDVWQANASGAYDNSGYRLRGHQYTDSAGRWRLDTIVPGLYPGRTRHIHVKVQAPNEPVLTTQLYFPGVTRNRTDSLYDRDLLVSRWRTVNGRRRGQFDFVLDVG